MSTTIESLELEIKSNSSQAISGIDALSSSLSKLKNSVKGGVGLVSVANQIQKLNSALQSVDGSSAVKIDRLANSLSKLSALGNAKLSASIGNQLKSIGSAAAELKDSNNATINNLATSIKNLNSVSGKASGLQSAIIQLKKLPELAASLREIDMSTLCSDLSQLSNALAPLASRAIMVSNAFDKLPSSISKASVVARSASSSNNTMSNSYVNLWAQARMAFNAIRSGSVTIGSWITKANEYIEDLNLFTASMGEYAGEAQKFAEKVGDLMGIDPGQFMRYEGVFNTIIEGFGVASDKAYIMSKNLTQLGYDLSSFYNISFEDSMQKLQSGISGELEPLRRLGYDLSVARLQQEAYNLGINKSVSAMTQAEKSQLRYYAIMTQVTVAQGDMARTLNAPANQIRVLQAQLTMCARTLGEVFIPALNAVLPYAIAVAKAIRLVAASIAKLFGFKLPKVDYSGIKTNLGAANDSVGNLANNAGSAGKNLGKAAKKAKELKNNMIGIDELHIISPTDTSISGSTGGTGGSGGGIGGIGGGDDLGFDLPEYDFLGKLVDTKADKILKKIKKVFKQITAIAELFTLAIGTILVISGANIPLGIALMAEGAAGIAALTALNWNKMSNSLARTLTAITGILGGFLFAIGAVLTFSGTKPDLGIAFMVAGAASLASSVFIGWNKMPHDIKSVLNVIVGILGGALFGVGAVLAFASPTNIPLGIALMAAGAATLAAEAGINWGGMPKQLKSVLSVIAGILGGAFLAIGAFLTFSGTAPEIGLPLMAAGAASMVSSVVLNWGGMTGSIKSAITTITILVSSALLALGFVLLWFGVNKPLAIGLIVAGAAGLVGVATLNGGTLLSKIKKAIGVIAGIVGPAFLVVGAILTFSGGFTPIGIGLLAAGAASIATAVALNWSWIGKKIKGALTEILEYLGEMLIVLGVLLLFTVAGAPYGMGLILAGVASWGGAVALNWTSVVNTVKKGLGKVADVFDDFKDSVKTKLGKVGDKISEWAGKVKDYASTGSNGQKVADNLGEISSQWGDKLKNGLSGKFKDSESWFSKQVTGPISNAIKNNPLPDIKVKVKNTSKDWWGKVKGWWSNATKEGVSMNAGIKLKKLGWSTIEKWIGNIPVLNQAIGLIKRGWSTIRGWIGSIPVLNQAISLIKRGWSNITSFVGDHVSVGISLFKKGWKHLKDFVGDTVEVGVTLVKKGWKNFKKFFGLSTGGYDTGHGFKLFERGGYIENGFSRFWNAIPKYANGTSNTGAHGSMFIAGENGAEMVGHINGQTEVLNRSQIQLAMRSAVISGMSQFVDYWKNLNSTMITCANAIIHSIVVSSDMMQAAYASVGASYDPSGILSDSVYTDAQKASNSYSDANFSKTIKDFYSEYVEPTLQEIATDTKRQADKPERVVVKIGNKTIIEAVETQQDANGYKFTK